MALKQIKISTLVVVNGVKKALNNLGVYKKAIKETSTSAEKHLRGQNKLTRRLADGNTKAFNLAALSVGPLVRAYAEVAASLWALERTWNAVNMAAKFQETKETFQVLGNTFNFNADVMLARIKKLSGGTVTAMNAMQNASLAMASGLKIEQLEALTTTARRAARAMGRTMPDAYDRIIRAVTKLEPELLDEIGLTTRLQNILGDYAKSVGKTVDQITSLEKTQIFTNAVIAEGTKKFGSINVEIQSMAERLEEMKSSIIDFSLALGANFVPIILGTLELFAKFSTTLTILGSAFLINKLRLALYRKEVLLAGRDEKIHADAIYAAAAAAKSESIAQTELATAIKGKNAAVIAGARLSLEEAATRTKTTTAIVAETAARRANTTATKLGAAALSKFGKVMTFITGPFGILTPIIIIILDLFGLLDSVWAKLSVSGAELTERIEKLTDAEQRLFAMGIKLNINQEALLTSIEEGRSKFIELDNGVSVLTSRYEQLDGKMRKVVTVIRELSDGTLQYITATGKGIEALAKVEDTINVITRKLVLQKALLEDEASGFTQQYIERAIELQKELERYGNLRKFIASEVAADEVKQASRLVELQKEVKNTGEFFTELGVSEKVFANSLQTPFEKLQHRIITTEKYLKIYQDRLAILPGKIDEAFKLDKSSVATLVAEADALSEIIPKQKEYIKTQKDRADAKKKLLRLTLPEAEVKSEIELLKLTKDRQFETIKGTNEYYDKLDSLQEKAFKLEADRIIAQQKIISPEEFQKRMLDLETKFAVKMHNIDKDRLDNIVKLNENQLKAILEIEDNAYDERIAALNQLFKITISKTQLSADEILALHLKLQDDIDDVNRNRVEKTGSVYDILLQKQKDFLNESITANERWADAIIDSANIIKDTLSDKIGTSLGLITDTVKENYQAQLEAAQLSFQGQIEAANAAFGTDQAGAGLDKSRKLQDLERGRARDIADLTAQRNAGTLDQAGFDAGLSSIETSVRRKTEDINLDEARSGEDAATTKQKSILDAHLEMNAAILEANKAFAEENDSIWTNMYDAIGQTVLDAMTNILTVEAQKNIFSLDNLFKAKQEEVNLQGDAESSVVKTLIQGTVAKVATAVPAIIAQFASSIPIIGPAIGAAVAAGITGLASSLIPSIIPSGSITGGTVPQITSMIAHTGGTLGGSSEEVSFVGLKGEGILNKYNGMKAVGGSRGVDYMNATGKAPTSGGTSINALNITIQDSKGNPNNVITIDNFEAFLRNQGQRTMRKVTKEGNVLIEKQGIAK